MLTQARAQVLDVTSKEWEIEGRRGTAHKVQLLVKQPEKFSVHTAKYDPTKIEGFVVGEEFEVTLEFKETQKGITTEVIAVTE